jgi:phosphatidylglycerophosphatase A
MGNLEEKPEVLAQRLAHELRSDSVLMGWVFRYGERVGNAWGARQPASVAFVALLFDGGDGKLLWRGRFDETQKPLSEDMMGLSSFVQRGGRWVTARELAADGVNRVLLSFPGEKEVGVDRW